MTFTYDAFKSTETAGVPAFPMTENNLLPALVVWLAFCTNPDFQNGLSDADKQQMVEKLGISRNTIDQMEQRANAYPEAFRQVATVFSNIGVQSNYGNPGCPRKIGKILELAPSAQVLNPDAGIIVNADLTTAEMPGRE